MGKIASPPSLSPVTLSKMHSSFAPQDLEIYCSKRSPLHVPGRFETGPAPLQRNWRWYVFLIRIGIPRIGAVTSLFFRHWNASCASGVHSHLVFLQLKMCRGLAMVAYCSVVSVVRRDICNPFQISRCFPLVYCLYLFRICGDPLWAHSVS